MKPIDLLRDLADGRSWSIETLTRKHAVSRLAVGEALDALRDLGIEIDAVQGHGYRWREPRELLDADVIRDALARDARALAPLIEVLPVVDSTNSYLLRVELAEGPRICLAEYQSHGKGRRGRRWISPFGANLHLSLLWRLGRRDAHIGSLGLLVGVAVAQVLEAEGIERAGLKWPNDLICEDKKLGGILIETTTRAGAPARIVIGVGINVDMPASACSDIEQPWIDMATVLRDCRPARNRLAARLIDALLQALQDFELRQPPDLVEAWRRYDVTRGKRVALDTPRGTVRGVAAGVDGFGRIVIEGERGAGAYTAGETSLRTCS